jgi:hypothetical protein
LGKLKKEGAMIQVLRYTEELEKVGFTPEQAKKSVQLWMDLMDQNFATKADFKEHYFMTRSDMKDVQIKLQTDMQKLQTEMKDLKTDLQTEMKDMQFGLESKIHKLEQSLTVRLGVMMAASIAIISTIVNFKH